MLENISKHYKSSKSSYTFSILIPTWNNLEFLKLCVNSITKNAHFESQIIVIINEGSDGTLDWVESQPEIDYVYAKRNIGICYGLNIARSLIKSSYVMYVNDDMYLLPDWDLELYKEIQRIGHAQFMLSGTLIEPIDTGNSCVIVKDFGREIQDFDENSLLSEYQNLYVKDWNGSTWPPNVVHIDMWDLVGGMSVEFSPGMYSDPDLSFKLMTAGVSIFKGIGTSLVYHFGSKSTKRIRKNKGRKTFIRKWGITSRTFTSQYLRIGQPFDGDVTEPRLSNYSKIINLIKRIKSSW